MVLLVFGDTVLNLDNMAAMQVTACDEGSTKAGYMILVSLVGETGNCILPPKKTKKSCVQLRDYILQQILRYDKGDTSVIIDVSKYDGK